MQFVLVGEHFEFRWVERRVDHLEGVHVFVALNQTHVRAKTVSLV
jgi:hypothetical protein